MRTIVDCLARHLIDIPERVLCHFVHDDAETPITFGELLEQAGRYARCYRQRGVHAGDSVIIVLRHSPHILYSFVGAMLAGAIPSIMAFPSEKQDPVLYWDSHRQLFRRVGRCTLVTYAENLADARARIEDGAVSVLLPEEINQSEPPGTVVGFPEVDPEAIAFLQHTSGTTGLKKGIALSHRAVLRQVESYRAALHLRPDDCIASWLPLYHDMGLIACFILPLLTGTPVVWMDPFEWVYRPALLFEAIERHRATLVWLPNFSFHHLAATLDADAAHDLSSVRAFINCSESCKADTFAQFLGRFGRMGVGAGQLQTCYAMAETVFAVTQSSLDRPVRVLGVEREALLSRGQAVKTADASPGLALLSVGPPVPGMHVRIVDDSRRPCPDGRVGEVAVAGDFLFSGYYRLPAETNAVLDGDWYHTGDLGFLHDGELYITGRKKDILIVNGRNYYAHDIEYLVSQVPGVKGGRCVAVGIDNADTGSEEVVVIAETGTRDEPARREMNRKVKQQVLQALNLHVREVHLVDPGWIVKTTSGKMDRAENKRKYVAWLQTPGEPPPHPTLSPRGGEGRVRGHAA
jgi:acyl-CoA synthetase (AMP-forming)/AMP-acid ligase II